VDSWFQAFAFKCTLYRYTPEADPHAGVDQPPGRVRAVVGERGHVHQQQQHGGALQAELSLPKTHNL
jgi:hypothetical protein